MLTDATTSPILRPSCEVCGLPDVRIDSGKSVCEACTVSMSSTDLLKSSNPVCKNMTDDWQPDEVSFEKCLVIGTITHKSCIISGNQNYNSILRRNTFEELRKQLPNSMETFLGRPHFLITFEPDKSCSKKFQIDASGLLRGAIGVLMTQPLIDNKTCKMNSLQRLAYGLNYLRESQELEIATLFTLNRDTCVSFYEHYASVVARWLSYCEEFNRLPLDVRLKIVKCIWLVWIRLERISIAAEMRGRRVTADKLFENSYETAILVDESDLDCEWFTNYSQCQIKHLMNFLETDLIADLLIPLLKLRPNDIELSFMLFQLCFHIAGKELGSGIVGLTSELIEKMAVNLHDYYSSNTNAIIYTRRFLMILKINQNFEKYTMLRKKKVNIARERDVFTVEFSDPELNNEMC